MQREDEQRKREEDGLAKKEIGHQASIFIADSD